MEVLYKPQGVVRIRIQQLPNVICQLSMTRLGMIRNEICRETLTYLFDQVPLLEAADGHMDSGSRDFAKA